MPKGGKRSANIPVASLQCSSCPFSTFSVRKYQAHTARHHGRYPFACEQCEYRCLSKHALIVHMRKHTGEKPYACSLCDYLCAQKSSLDQHLRRHTGERPYSCDDCEYKGTQLSHLLQHIRRHTGEKPYQCAICQYSCTQPSILQSHMQTHQVNKARYKCKEPGCRYTTLKQGYLLKHRTQKHFNYSDSQSDSATLPERDNIITLCIVDTKEVPTFSHGEIL